MRMWVIAYALLVFYFLTNGKTAMHEYIGNMIFFMAALMLMETRLQSERATGARVPEHTASHIKREWTKPPPRP